MKNEFALRIKEIRKFKGYSQEELSEKSGLSIRTIQRIENGESDPRGDTLKKLSGALEVLPEEIMDWGMQEDNGFLTNLNLSALSFIIFPLFGILVPIVLWISKKNKIKKVDEVARHILDFQITWTMILFVGSAIGFARTFLIIGITGEISSAALQSRILTVVIFIGLMYLYNLFITIINTSRINRRLRIVYNPSIRILRERKK